MAGQYTGSDLAIGVLPLETDLPTAGLKLNAQRRDTYQLLGIRYVIRRTDPVLDRIKIVSVVIKPISRLMPAKIDPSVTPVAANITSCVTISSRL